MIGLPHLAIGAAVAVLVAGAGGYLAGRSDGRKLEAAEHRKVELAIAEARDAMAAVAAEKISEIEVRNVTIRQKAETITREVPVYRDCRHDPDGLRLVNAALTGSDPDAAQGGVPAADRARGSQLRRDDDQAD